MTSLNISFWNLNGHKSQYIGDNLSDSEFIDNLAGIDIIGLGELHAESEVSIPDFVSKKQKLEKKNSKDQKLQVE